MFSSMDDDGLEVDWNYRNVVASWFPELATNTVQKDDTDVKFPS